LYSLAILFTVMAMKCKETAFTLPIVITATEFIFFRATPAQRVKQLWPFIATLVIIPLSIFISSQSSADISEILGISTKETANISRTDYLITQFRVLMTYIRLMLFPANQNLDYDYPIYHTLFNAEIIASILAVMLLAAFAVHRYVISQTKETGSLQNRLTAYGICFFFISLSVESSFIPIRDVIFEHRLYLPSVGLILAIVSYFDGLCTNHRSIAFCLMAMVVVLLASLTIKRNKVWESPESIWYNTVKNSPKKTRPYINLSNQVKIAGDYDKAIEILSAALVLDPKNTDALILRANAYDNLGFSDMALHDYNSAIAIEPDNMNIYYERAVCFKRAGDLKSALDDFITACNLGDPDSCNLAAFMTSNSR
jgi:tetratricopeptide (TPR) repeat protein